MLQIEQLSVDCDGRKLTIDNSDLGTIQSRAMSGMLGVQELNIINSKIDKVGQVQGQGQGQVQVVTPGLQVRENVISQETQVKRIHLEGNHLLAVPQDFDYMVYTEKTVLIFSSIVLI